MAQIMDGREYSKEILAQIKLKVEKLQKKPSLAVILVGNDTASQIYVNNKEKTAQELGFISKTYRLKENTSSNELKDLILNLNLDEDTDAILLQLPLPKHLVPQDFIELIDPKKDVDGFHPINCGRLLTNSNPYAISCTPKGVIKLLKKYNVQIQGANTLVIGRSNMVGKPLIHLFLEQNATVTVAHSKTKNLPQIARTADILISATGIKGLVTKDFVKSGAVVVDVGISRDENGKIKGDVDFEEVSKVASLITPVPGGIGPMTIAMLMENTLELSLKNAKF